MLKTMSTSMDEVGKCAAECKSSFIIIRAPAIGYRKVAQTRTEWVYSCI